MVISLIYIKCCAFIDMRINFIKSKIILEMVLAVLVLANKVMIQKPNTCKQDSSKNQTSS